ncbi:MAG: ATP-dependent RNA helicase DbpA [Gammaproteobacteria bacterium]|nr:ATP-dependent RNA helicase DbpA [Gammaproteobacteria bacterium]
MDEQNFTKLNLDDSLLSNLGSLGFVSMTAIQAESLPAILAGNDVLAKGPTGSGKTVAFGLGVLSRLDTSLFQVQSMVLCPTRELAEQVSMELRRLARSTPNVKILTLCGGTALRPQVTSLENGVHIVVGTPGRIEDHLNKGSLDLGQLNSLVLDEADRMLDLGFQKTLGKIIAGVPERRQTLLFSATIPESIAEIARQIMRNPQKISVAPTRDTVRVEQFFYKLGDEQQRMTALQLLLLDHAGKRTAVFCNTRKDTQTVTGALKGAGFAAAALHGEMQQKDRDQTLIRFANGSASILVATDVAARGLDIESLDLVINFQLPRELDVYTHRIGRTARAGARGLACSLFSASEQFRVDQLADRLGHEIAPLELPPLAVLNQCPPKPKMSTLRIEGGKKQKLRPGDIVGALTSDGDIGAGAIGKIQVLDNWSYVAIGRGLARTGLRKIQHGKLKGKSFRARLI